jgi:hypothetical protein
MTYTTIHTQMVAALEEWERLPSLSILISYDMVEGVIPELYQVVVGDIDHEDFDGWVMSDGIMIDRFCPEGQTLYFYVIDGNKLMELLDESISDDHLFALSLNHHAQNN